MKIIICGGPKTGKTSLAKGISINKSIPIRHTDDLILTHKWGEDSDEVEKWINEPGDFIIEGVTAHRGLRKWFINHAHPNQEPNIELIYVMNTPHTTLTREQEIMRKGFATQWAAMLPTIRGRQIPVVQR